LARPNKQGAEYFPLDVHLDDKFKFIEIKYKLPGFAVIIKLIQKVYSYGYWYKWTEDEALLFSDEIRADFDLVKGVVNEAIERGIFNKELHTKYSILTSKGIQKRYKEIVRRRKDVEVTEEYLLIDNSFGVNDDINPSSSIQNDVKSTQSKVKESKEKVKESKVNKSKDETPYVEIISYLNTKTSSSYKPAGKKTKELIHARWEEGFRLDDFKKVIDIKTDEWLHDSKMVKFLRPETLFSNKFEGYLNQKTVQAKGQWDRMTEKTPEDEAIFGKPIEIEYNENDFEF
jgi:uncharacterized phage protein (TIGR02220 family)